MNERQPGSKTSLLQGTLTLLSLIMFLNLAPPSPLWAADQASDDWRFRIAPYLWAISLDGNITARGRTADVDASFSDIVKDLNGGIFLLAEAQKGPVSLFGDVTYADLESESSRGPFSVETDVDLLVFNFGVAYQAAKFRLNEYDAERPISLLIEPILGGRLFYLDTKLKPSRIPSVSSSETWVDPVVGLRLSSDVTPRWNLRAVGDIGGFGVSSELTWQAMALAGYRFGLFADNDANAVFGYRALFDDYKTGSGTSRSGIDATFHGPILGLEIKF